jgi:hypothetical protein
MPRLRYRSAANYFFLWLIFSLVANFTWAQSETATVSGQVVDPSGLNIAGAQVKLVDIDRDTSTGVTTNNSGLYTFPSVRPGRYRIAVTAAGFKVVNVTGVTVNVQDHLEQNFKLVVGSVSESVTVEGGTSLVDTDSAAISTVIDRQFAENLPLNGRSFQTLIQLTPGVVLTANNGYDSGQFSVNGQRASSNYWMVDGVSANIGISATANSGNGLGGSLGSSSVLGGTNSLVSVDAMQEFRIQTSTFAPEFGRTPGGQISIVTRSGTNQFHGTAFNYLRNDALDANNWFNGYTNNPPLPKAKERQNDFGGTLGGPILKDKTFFFFSFEGLRLRLPQTALTLVPDTNPQDPYSRQFAQPALLPYLNAYPLPNGPEVLLNGVHQGVAQLNASFSNPATLDAYSLRIDHSLKNRLNLFARYDFSPSKITSRGAGSALSDVSPTRITTQTATAGLLWTISNLAANNFRLNYSETDAKSSTFLDNFGGAEPPGTLPFPPGFTSENGLFVFDVFSLGNNPAFGTGEGSHNRQRQLNLVDSVSLQKGVHAIKIGIDFRRLTPLFRPTNYSQLAYFSDVSSAETGALEQSNVSYNLSTTFLFRNLGIFAQDTWHVAPRLTLTYGLRWDIDFVPASLNGPGFPSVVGFNLSNLANLALAPAGTPPYKTTFGNVAPRFGLAYQLSQSALWQTVVRAGFGFFYDLATSEAGNTAVSGLYPFGSTGYLFGGATFPLSASQASPVPIEPPDASNGGALYGFDPNLRLPYTLQWSAAVEQSLGKQQSLTASYIGSAGRRLLQTAGIAAPNPNLDYADLVTNASTSDYDALQIQFRRQMSHGLQALTSYTWSHAIDTASAGSYGNPSNEVSALNSNINRGSSDFDIRNAFSIALTYDVPALGTNPVGRALLGAWSIDNVVQAQSARPVDVNYVDFGFANGFQASTRPDIVAGQPFYLYGAEYPGGKAFNPTAFTPPPLTPPGCVLGSYPCFPVSQGDLPRNALRGFGLAQWDFALHRTFPIHESVKLQFRGEMFNLLNHPNFAPPSSILSSYGIPNPQFGQSLQMLGQGLAGTGNSGNGAFSPLYQLGGPRSIQFALKLFF